MSNLILAFIAYVILAFIPDQVGPGGSIFRFGQGDLIKGLIEMDGGFVQERLDEGRHVVSVSVPAP